MARRVLFALLSIVPIAACSSQAPDVPAEPEGDVASTSAALTTSDAIARAEEWVSVKLKYCQAPNGARDYDAACSTYCSREKNAAWDPYRSDCSGFVSWSWALPAPGRITTQFAPFETDITKAIAASDLREGDAINNSTHIMLFKSWVTPGKRAVLLEEPGCSSSQPYAREDISDVTISGSSIYVASHGESFTAIRYAKIAESIKGVLDQASCDGLGGWAQDPQAPGKGIDVVLAFGAAAGKPGAQLVKVASATNRDDLCKALGSCNHAFDLAMPLGARTGKAVPVYAYGADSSGKPTTVLDNAPKTLTCAPPAFPVDAKSGVKRSLADLGAWKLDAFADVAREAQSAVDAYPAGPGMPAAPAAVQADDGSPDLWVVDGALKRHADAASLAAWKMTPAKGAAADVKAMAEGPAWPAAPFAFQGDDGKVYALDVAVPAAAGGAPAPPAAADGGDSGGCAVTPSSRSGAPIAAFAMVLAALAAKRRRRH
ncbi:MAG TPA: MYXO-CTERM sorting domain-containing protein [Labilithrix sp.]